MNVVKGFYGTPATLIVIGLLAAGLLLGPSLARIAAPAAAILAVLLAINTVSYT